MPTIQSLTTNERPRHSADAGFTVTFEDVRSSWLRAAQPARHARPAPRPPSRHRTPTSDGVVTVQVPAGTAHDDAGNENPASVAPKLTFDRTDPVITPPGSIRLELGDLYVQPAAACFDAIDSNPAVTVTVDDVDVNQVGVYTLTHACTDDAGNLATATSTVIVFDPSGFATSITSDPASPTSSPSVEFTVIFGEQLGSNTLEASEMEISPPVTISDFVSNLGDTYTFTLAGLTDNTYTVTVPLGVVNSTLGSPNSLASIRVTVDHTAPTVTSLTASEQSPTNAQGATFTATFSEPVAFDSGISDISVTGGAASNLSPSGTASSFTFTVTPAGDGEVTVRVLSDTTRDGAGNYNTASDIAFLTFDRTAPTVTSLTTSEQSPTNSADAGFTVTFSEDVTFAGDILVTGGTASPARPTGTASSFTFTVAPTSDGVVTVQVPAGTAHDDAGNENPASVAPKLTFDRTDPVITPPGSIRLELGDLYVQPAAACSDAIDSNPAVTVTVDDVDVNQVGVYTLTHACTDDAGNLATATSTVIVFDPSGFATSITSDPASPTSSPSVEFTVIFGEQLGSNTLEASEMEISPPVTISDFVSNLGDTYTFTLEGLTDNTYTVTVPQGVVNSTLGSPNSLASIRVTVDHTAPTVTSLTASEQSPTNAHGATFTATFSEPVAFDSGISDISVTGGAASNLSPSGTASSFTFTVTPAGDGEVTVRVLSDTTRDGAGNYNTASDIAFLTFDRTAPTVTSLTTSEHRQIRPMPSSPSRSEDVTFARDILVWRHSQPGTPDRHRSSFTFTVTPATRRVHRSRRQRR